ncbi:MAG: hypothetical protein WBS18_00960 [Candidatus Acidiferrales bacterium]
MDHIAPDSSRHLLRHTVATLAYRAGKALRDAPPSFAEFHAGEKARTPGQILAHIADLFDWALSAARGKQEWRDSAPLSWDRGTERFFAALEAFDKYLSSEDSLHCSVEQLFQGPVADALTHVGQIAILRRIAGVPIRGENYLTAKITIGRAGADQPAPVMEFE